MITSWQSGDVEANGIRLHYTRTGGTRPPLVLAHGVTDSGLCWTPIAEALEAEYDVIMVDARGHGRSEAPAQGYDPATQANDLAGMITALGLHRPLLLGHSMGAITVLVLAGAYPDVPGAILLEDPPGWWMPEDKPSPADMQRLSQMRARFTGHKGKTREELIAGQRAAAPRWSDAELAPWADAKLQVSDNVINIFTPGTGRALDWPATLRRVTCPALLLTADRALGAALTEEAAAALRALVPQLQIAHITGAGHNIRREQFDRFLEVVRAFLTESAAS
jgi:pimeloyl-ACP methyl ester carboxylesterase